jgi:hypothetical protein
VMLIQLFKINGFSTHLPCTNNNPTGTKLTQINHQLG